VAPDDANYDLFAQQRGVARQQHLHVVYAIIREREGERERKRGRVRDGREREGGREGGRER